MPPGDNPRTNAVHLWLATAARPLPSKDVQSDVRGVGRDQDKHAKCRDNEGETHRSVEVPLGATPVAVATIAAPIVVLGILLVVAVLPTGCCPIVTALLVVLAAAACFLLIPFLIVDC